MQIPRSIEWDTTTQMPNNRNKLQQMREKEDTMRMFADKKNINNRTVKRLVEKQPFDRSQTSSELNESIHHIKEI